MKNNAHHVSSWKILSVTCDNASTNDTMMDELEFMLAHFKGQATRVRCHTPNMFGTVNMECTVDLRLSWSER